MRLRRTFSPGVGYSVVTFDQSHSSSSATSWARPVSVPCPISERAMRITTLSSGWITTPALSSCPSAACAEAQGKEKPSEKPPTTVPLAMKPRREIGGKFGEVWIVMLAALRLGGGVNRLAHLLIGAAAADVGHRRVDLGVGRRGLGGEQRGSRHDHAALAVTALGNVVFEPSLLDLVQLAVLGEALDGGDLLAARDGAQRHMAGARRHAVDVHRAGAALGDAAAVLRASEAQGVAQHPQQRRTRIGVRLDRLSVD